MQQTARINAMPSAPKKAPNWRRSTITAIKSRSTKQLGDPRAYAAYIETRFGKSSLADLTDDELQQTRVYVFGRTPKA
ncbi:MAG: hypothetical protein AUJ55_11725 [Proteobacteria bacterium CG1_02_64_396]|nr:MAG: hypothetical protein AUJ55_11725 [Proteobacteria bacterium CG1_02_64_396]